MRKLKPKLRPSENDQLLMIGFEVAFWRESRAMSQKELAAILGISQRKLRYIENNKDVVSAPGYIHWSLKGLDAQTRQMRHVIYRLSGAIEPIEGKELILMHHETRYYDASAHVTHHAEIEPRPHMGPPQPANKLYMRDGLGPVDGPELPTDPFKV